MGTIASTVKRALKALESGNPAQAAEILRAASATRPPARGKKLTAFRGIEHLTDFAERYRNAWRIKAGREEAKAPCPVCERPLSFARLAVLAVDRNATAFALVHIGCAMAWMARAWQWLVEVERVRVFKQRKFTGHDGRPWLRRQLSTCACGHDAADHKRDAIENLLHCERAKCDCDHFHYALKAAKQAA